MKAKSIVLVGRRWFDKKNGNTYHDVEIIVHFDRNRIVQHRTDMDLGYGDHYIQSAAEWLESQTVLKLKRYGNGGVQPLHQYCQENSIRLITTVSNVIDRKELQEKDR